MNQKIKQLAEQAGQGDPFHIPPEFIDKFAELIIIECCRAVGDGHSWKSITVEEICRPFGIKND